MPRHFSKTTLFIIDFKIAIEYCGEVVTKSVETERKFCSTEIRTASGMCPCSVIGKTSLDVSIDADLDIHLSSP